MSGSEGEKTAATPATPGAYGGYGGSSAGYGGAYGSTAAGGAYAASPAYAAATPGGGGMGQATPGDPLGVHTPATPGGLGWTPGGPQSAPHYGAGASWAHGQTPNDAASPATPATPGGEHGAYRSTVCLPLFPPLTPTPALSLTPPPPPFTPLSRRPFSPRLVRVPQSPPRSPSRPNAPHPLHRHIRRHPRPFTRPSAKGLGSHRESLSRATLSAARLRRHRPPPTAGGPFEWAALHRASGRPLHRFKGGYSGVACCSPWASPARSSCRAQDTIVERCRPLHRRFRLSTTRFAPRCLTLVWGGRYRGERCRHPPAASTATPPSSSTSVSSTFKGSNGEK